MIRSISRFAVLFACSVPFAACVEAPADDLEDVDSEEQAIEAMTLNETSVSIDGAQAGWFTSITVGEDEKGPTAVAVFDVAQGSPILKMIVDASNGVGNPRAITVQGRDAKGTRRSIAMTDCLVKELSFPTLEAAKGKKQFTISIKFQPENIEYVKGDDKVVTPPRKSASYVVTGDGIDPAWIVGVMLPAVKLTIAEESTSVTRLPTRHYSAWEPSGLRATTTSEGSTQIQKVIDDGAITDEEYTDWGVDIHDDHGAHAERIVFRTKKKPKTVTTTSVDWLLEQTFLENKHE